MPSTVARYSLGVRDAGLYLRISKDLKGEGLAVERQRADGTRLIGQRGWRLSAEYVDNDITASGRKRRPGFEQMMSDVESGRITVIVALSLDRLTRNRRDQLRLVETCQQHGTLVALVRGSDIDMSSAVGRAMADMMAVWARMEIEQKSERHIAQIAQAAEKGRMVGGRRAFGYTVDGLHLDPDEAPLVRQMYDMWLSGSPLGAIKRWLNGLGCQTPRGNQWQNHSVREVLANPRNAGLRGMRDVVNAKTGTRSQWHRIIGPAAWPAIVAEETWRATMQHIKDPNRPGNHRGIYPSRHLLTGLAVCGVCEQAGRPGVLMVAGRRDGAALLRCPTNSHLCRVAARIEDYVEEQVVERFCTDEGRKLLAAASSTARPGEDPAELRARSISLRARLRKLAEDYADDLLDREEFRVAKARVKTQLDDVDQRIAAMGAVDVVGGMLASSNPEEEWDGYSVDRKREIIRRIMTVTVLPGRPGRPGGVRFDPDSVQVEWR